MADPQVELWAMDEVHFQQHGSRCRMWVPPEVRDPVSLHHPTRKQVGYFGAVRLSDGRFHYQRESGRFNARTCWDFLRSLRKGFLVSPPTLERLRALAKELAGSKHLEQIRKKEPLERYLELYFIKILDLKR